MILETLNSPKAQYVYNFSLAKKVVLIMSSFIVAKFGMKNTFLKHMFFFTTLPAGLLQRNGSKIAYKYGSIQFDKESCSTRPP
jgi:hypothetical protein